MGCVNSSNVHEVAQDHEFCPVPLAHKVPPAQLQSECSPKEDSDSEIRSFHREYDIANKLGKGAFAHVYKAQRLSSVESCAVKITDLRSKADTHVIDEKCRRQVEREISTMRKVSGVESCIKVLDVFLEQNRSYIVMEMCESTLVESLKKNKALNENTLKPYVVQMFQATAALHKIRVVHRDLKPSNFLIKTSPEGKAILKLCDFGLAATLPNGSETICNICGTPPFMCPEMVQYESYGAKCDVWSLGVNLYIFLCGRFPYVPADQTGQGMKLAIATGAQLHFDDEVMSADAKALMAGLLKRDVEQRWTAEEALRSAWCSKPHSDGGHSCLKATIQEARKLGAFEESNSTKALDNNPRSIEMDKHLRYMQNKLRMHRAKSNGSFAKDKDMNMSETLSTNSTVAPSNSNLSFDTTI